MVEAIGSVLSGYQQVVFLLGPIAVEDRRQRRAKSDTVIVPTRDEGFKSVFLAENQWYQIRIGAAPIDARVARQLLDQTKAHHLA